MRRFLLLFCVLWCAFASATVTADFSADRFSGCPPLLSNFTNTSTTTSGTLSYRWDFANGSSSMLPNPSASFISSGTYRVQLIVSNGVEHDTVTKSVVVFYLPQVDFNATQVSLCMGDTLRLNSNVIPGDGAVTDYAWGLGNGIALSGTNVNYVYPQPGSYDITLVVQDANTCAKNLTKQLFVQVNPRPVAQFTATPNTSCAASELVTFTNTSTGAGLSYSWTLDDSITSTVQNPTYTYSQQVQQVWLRVTNSFGCVDSTMRKVSVTEVIASFTANKTTVCSGEPIVFTNTSNFATSTHWDFGDGTTSFGGGITKTYTAPGVYTVKMITRFGQCTDTITKIAYITVTQGFNVSFSASTPGTGCNDTTPIVFTNTTPGGVQFVWNFGDGSTSTSENPSHLYNTNGNFNVSLTVTDSNGCSIQGVSLTTIDSHKPVPAFSVASTSCPNTRITFQNTTAGGVSFIWSFGDGDSSYLKNPIHYYTNPGVYTVSLTVISANGCDSTVVKHNCITIESIEADFTVNQTFSPCPPFVTLFSSTVNKSGVSYYWNFGDGKTDNVANPTHIYFHPGIFTVTLIVVAPNGCTDTVIYPDLIEVQGPFGLFGATPTSGCVPLTVSFVGSVSSNTMNMWCDLGDGSLITDSLVFNYTYTELGSFNPKFILVDHVGCTVPYELSPIVTHTPPALQLFDTTVCEGATINVSSLGSDQYKWNSTTDIDCDTCSSVVIKPSYTTAYVVTATNPYCSVNDTMHVHVDMLPVLTPSSIKVCKNSANELNVGDAFSIKWSPAVYLNDSTAIKPICTPSDSISYDVTAYNSLGCSVTTKVDVIVLDKLSVEAIGDITTCALDTFQLQSVIADGPDSGVNYTWSPAAYLNVSDIANPTGFGIKTETVFQVIVTTGTCTADTANVTVHVQNLPDLNVSENATTTPYAEVGLWATSSEYLSYEWKAQDSLSCITCNETNLYPSQTQTIYVTGTNENGCATIDSVTIKVVPCDPESVFLPNVFTPNGDGLNDILFMSSKALTSINFFRIFDEWGRMVFETKNINDTWDGKVNGMSAPTDVFAYVLEGKCQNGSPVLKYGNITLVR